MNDDLPSEGATTEVVPGNNSVEIVTSAPEPEPAPEAAPAPEVSPDPVIAARERIAAARAEEVRQESKVETPEPQPEPPAGTAEVPSAGPTPDGETAAPASPTNDPEPKRFKLKVNGAEREVTEADVLAAAQRQLAGEDAFRRAAALRQGDAPKAPTPQPAGMQPQNTPAASTAPASGPSSEQFDAWSKAIAYGDDAQVKQALAEYRDALAVPPATSNEDVAQQINRAIAFSRTNDAHLSAWNKVGNEYAEVRADPNLLGVARNVATVEAGKALVDLGIYTVDQVASAHPSEWWQRLTEAHAAGYPVDFETIYRAGAKGAWEKYGRPAAPQPPPATVSQLAERRDAKAGAIQPPRPQNASAVVPPPQAKTPAETVAEIKRMRGL